MRMRMSMSLSMVEQMMSFSGWTSPNWWFWGRNAELANHCTGTFVHFSIQPATTTY